MKFAGLCFGVLVFLVSGFAARAGEAVDLNLVILADVSYSMDRDEKILQQEGFAGAMRDARVVEAILAGPAHRIAVAYVEWGGEGRERLVIPWTLVDSQRAAEAFSDQLLRNGPAKLPNGTSVGSALNFAARLLETSPFDSKRQVINISGDGTSNTGPDPVAVRQALVSSGIIINGLPIVYKGLMDGVVRPSGTPVPKDFLIRYFNETIIGGRGAFLQPVVSKQDFHPAILKKMYREIMGYDEIARRNVPAVMMAKR